MKYLLFKQDNIYRLHPSKGVVATYSAYKTKWVNLAWDVISVAHPNGIDFQHILQQGIKQQIKGLLT